MEIGDKVIWDSGFGFSIGEINQIANDDKANLFFVFTCGLNYYIITIEGRKIAVRREELKLYNKDNLENAKLKYKKGLNI
jgi:hypothetical protein